MAPPPNLSGLKVSHIMSPNVILVHENDPVSFVIKIFDRCNISGAPVVNDLEEYVGVVSKTDLFDKSLLEYLNEDGNLDHLPIRCIMNATPPLMLEDGTSVEKAAEMMLHNHIHRVFIHSKERIVGVVSSYDILKVVASTCNEPSLSVIESDKEKRFLNIRAQLQKSSIKSKANGTNNRD
jgi:CBS domain-containing protein